MLTCRLACAVGDEDGDVTACAGDGADEGADEAAGEDVGPDLLDGLPVRQDVGDLLVGLLLMLFAADDALNAGDDFRDSEQTDQSGDELEAVQQAGLLGGDEAGDAVGGVEADGAEQHTEEGADEALGHRLAGNCDDDRQAEDGQHEHLAGAEVHGHVSNQRRQEGHDQCADDAAAEGGEHSDGQCLAGLPLLAHGVAVQQGGGCSGRAGGVDEDSGNGTAVHTAAVDAQQQADGRDEVHAEGEGDEQRHAHGGGHARDSAQQNAAQCADEGHQKDLGVGPDSRIAGKKQTKIHNCAPSLYHVHEGAQEVQRTQRNIDGKHLVEHQPHQQRHQNAHKDHLHPVALADEEHDDHREHHSAQDVAAALEQSREQHTEEHDEVSSGHALILEGIQSADFGSNGVGGLHGTHQLEDGLDEQDHREDEHTHDHDAGEGGSLHIGVGHLREIIGLEPRPDADGEENDGAYQIGEGHRFHFVFVQKGFLLSISSHKKGQA